MKKIILTTALVGALWLCYAFFQNVLSHNFGWKPLPSQVFNHSFQGVASHSFEDEIDKARVSLKQIHQISSAPAVSIAVRVKQQTIWAEALGLKNIENELPADTSTQFRIGSTSKALTALGLGRLMETGAINIDSSIQYYSGHFLDKPKITVRQLVSHQSGIRNYGICFCTPIWEYYRNKVFNSVEESLDDFESDDLLFEPGARFSYSSYNFTALSLAMEKSGSQDFLKLMNQRIFEPLEMYLTHPNGLEISLNESEFYDIRDGEYKISPEVNLSNKWAGGGFMSTPSDLVKAGSSLLHTQFLNNATINQLIEPQKLNDGKVNEQSYALGWRHGASEMFLSGKKEVEIIHHGGMAVGSQSLLIVFPEFDLTIALLMNRTGTQGSFRLFEYIQPIADIFLTKLEIENR